MQRSSVSGTPAFRIFSVSNGAELSLNSLTISGGNFYSTSNADAAGILNLGALTLTNSIVSNNTGYGTASGGILSSGVTTLINSIVHSNSGFVGGGVRNFGGLVTLTNTLVYNNSGSLGSGIFNGTYGTVLQC